MDKDKSILLQKQVRDNSEDLQKELLDLKNWEQEMKRKEAELLNAGGDQIKVLPPIRSKKQKMVEKSPPIASTSKSAPGRIKSSDYSAWDKFDVDAAIRKLDDEDESDGSVEDLEENAEKKHAEATKFKEQGNVFVQKRLYEKAIESYSEAIKLFPYDEVFYANRALCYLKIENLYSAEADCTAALQMNDCYVKAYHRRATARMGLKQYDDAKKDIEQMLNLEPTNKEAKSMLAQVNKKLNKSKPLVTLCPSSPESPENKSGEKVWNADKLKEQTAIQKQLIRDMQKVKESTKSRGLTITEIPNDDEEEQVEEKLPDWLPKLGDDFRIVKPVQLSPHLHSQKPLKRIPVKEADFENGLLPKLEKGESEKVEKSKVDENHINLDIPEKTVEAEKSKEESTNVKETRAGKKPEELIKPSLENKTEPSKPSSFLEKLIQEQEEKEKMKNETIKVDETEINKAQTSLTNPPGILQKLIQKQEEERKLSESLKSIESESPQIIETIQKIPEKVKDKPLQKISKKSDEMVKENSKIEDSSFEVPPAPKTSVQFLMDWKISKSSHFRYLYLKKIPPEVIPTMFKESMESNIFSDIICVLKDKFTSNEKNVFQYLEHLSNVKRFRMLIMFIERNTREALKELLTHCKTQEGRSEEEIDELRKKYEL